MSLNFFYEVAHQEVNETYTEAPEKEVALELPEPTTEKFEQELHPEKNQEKR